MIKKIILFFIFSMIFCFILFFSFIKVMERKSESLLWLSNFHKECSGSASLVSKDSPYGDLIEVLKGKYNTEKMIHYRDSCVLSDGGQCQYSGLYLAKSFMARRDEKDFELANSLLTRYKSEFGEGLYYHAVSLDIFLRKAWMSNEKQPYYREYKVSLSQSDYKDIFAEPHDEYLCEQFLVNVGELYRGSGDWVSEFYIRLRILTK
jgi:hypothetical protein